MSEWSHREGPVLVTTSKGRHLLDATGHCAWCFVDIAKRLRANVDDAAWVCEDAPLDYTVTVVESSWPPAWVTEAWAEGKKA
jgi:hypothetical protein